MSDTNLPEFAGKIILIYLKQDIKSYSGGVVIEYPEFIEYGGRIFLSGRSVSATGDNWNIPTGVAWDEVATFMIFSSREELVENMVSDDSLMSRFRKLGKK